MPPPAFTPPCNSQLFHYINPNQHILEETTEPPTRTDSSKESMITTHSNKRPTPAINRLCQKPLPVRARHRPMSPKRIPQPQWKKTRKQRAHHSRENWSLILTILRSQLMETIKKPMIPNTMVKKTSTNRIKKPWKVGNKSKSGKATITKMTNGITKVYQSNGKRRLANWPTRQEKSHLQSKTSSKETKH